mmetsp:Transcript_36845/g.103957  ORF Transcript_36845/g.103957 Transcript_36845/m.103957 type:complete len:532 (+) Transcript_36845:1573-3168(+)
MPQNTFACQQSYNSDPAKSGIDCSPRENFLSKYASTRLEEQEPDLMYLFNKWSFSTEQQYELMAFERGGGGEFGYEEAACKFLKANTSVQWVSWLKIHNRCIEFGSSYEWDEGQGKCVNVEGALMTIIYAIAGASAGSIIVAVLFFLWYRRQQAKKTNPLIGVNVKKELLEVYNTVFDMGSGKVATYIPELATANPRDFGLALCTTSGKVYEVGNSDVEFTIQSASKPFLYGQLLMERDEAFVKTKINVEPSGEAFNSDKLAPDGRPFNPLINQGAIACSCLVSSYEADHRYEQARAFMSSCCTRNLQLDKKVYQSEAATGKQNEKIVQVLRNVGVVETDHDMHHGLQAYFMACSTKVSCRDLATMAATCCNKGINPMTKAAVMSPEVAESVSSVMMSCGMYNGAGNWMMDVGLPAKSGVSGCLMAVVPGVCGIAMYSPKLNEHGNSVRAIEACTLLSQKLNLHVLKKKGNDGGSHLGSQLGKSAMGKSVLNSVAVKPKPSCAGSGSAKSGVIPAMHPNAPVEHTEVVSLV